MADVNGVIAMPKILDAAVKRIKAKGHSTSSAYAIATSTLQKAGELKKGHNKPTKLGVKRGQMTRGQRHKRPV
jgi:hypothetical protein